MSGTEALSSREHRLAITSRELLTVHPSYSRHYTRSSTVSKLGIEGIMMHSGNLKTNNTEVQNVCIAASNLLDSNSLLRSLMRSGAV